MYQSPNFTQPSVDTFELVIPTDRPFKILQLTDLHLGFGLFSGKKDQVALAAIRTLIERTEPDLITLTGDSVYPFWLQAGTANNKKQAEKFLAFMDGFEIPYAIVMGNHDTELGSRLNRRELGQVYQSGKYCVFAEGPEDIYGVGNYVIKLMRGGCLKKALVFLDSNMYLTKWFFDGFDCIHRDQIDWCMKKLDDLKKEAAATSKPEDFEALAFYHMPLPEFKEAYEKMKLGDTSVRYHFGTIAEDEDYFGISPKNEGFFEAARENGCIRYMFCGHDHLNNISLTYKGIQLTYGMSIDCLGYKGIVKKEVQRGATEILLTEDSEIKVAPVPLTDFVTRRVRGAEKFAAQEKAE